MEHKMTFREISYAFQQSIPVMLGYIFLGIAFGLILQHAGYGPIWALCSSLFIYAGSMQFVLVSLLTDGVGLIYAAIMTFFINGRHIFYGLTFIEKFRKMGKAYPYMVASLTDETYSLLCDLKLQDGMNEKRVYLYISLLDHLYWIIGSVLGSVAGELMKFDITGIDFSMTALFVVIVVNQWMERKNHWPAIIGFVVGLLCLIAFGPDRFLLPSLGITSLILLGGKAKWNMQS